MSVNLEELASFCKNLNILYVEDEKNETGLGLYMSKVIVEEYHNGKISVENREDGVCFTIELKRENKNEN